MCANQEILNLDYVLYSVVDADPYPDPDSMEPWIRIQIRIQEGKSDPQKKKRSSLL
jgi:hypothetical protein